MNVLNKMALWWLSKSTDISRAFKMLRGQNQPRNTASMPYKQVDIVFACVNKILTTLVGRNVPLVISTDKEEIVESGPVYDILFRNPKLPFDRFAYDWLGNYVLFCDVFIKFEDPIDPMSPFEVIGGPRMREQIDLSDGSVRLWDYTDDAGHLRHATPQQVRHTFNFNPYSPYHGVGPLSACDNAIQYIYSLILRNASAMRNGAEMGVVLQAPVGSGLQEDQIRAILAAFDARYAGPDKAMSTALLTGGLEAKTLAMKMVDLQAAEIDEAQACRVAATIGVPPQLLGLKTEAQYSGGPAMRDFIFNTCMPHSALFAGVITEAICSRLYPSQVRGVKLKDSKSYGHLKGLRHKQSYRQAREKALQDGRPLFAWFDWDQHPTVQEARQEAAQRVLEYKRADIPVNQIVDAYDLPFDTSQMPWGEFAWGTAGQLPLPWILDGGLEAVLGPDLPEGETDEPDKDSLPLQTKDIEEKSTRIWQKYVASWQGLEREMQEAVRQFLRRQKNGVLERLRREMAESKTVRTKADDRIMRILFDLRVENNQLAAIHRVFYKRGVAFGAAQVLRETTGLSGEDLTAAADRAARAQSTRRAMIKSAHKIQKVNQATRRWLTETLQEGLAKGEGLSELSRRISGDPAFSAGRAKNIARTSTSGSVSAGRHEGLKTVSDRKGWLSARNDSVRDSHRAADAKYGQSTGGIPINEKFTVGTAQLMYPADPDGEVGEVANCRCMLIAVQVAGKQLDLDYYDKQVAFLSYTDFKTLLKRSEDGLE